MKKYQLASLLSLVALVHGQSLVDIRTQTKNVDFSGAPSTIPAKSGTTLPATCNVGEQFFKTNNTPGQNLYSCAPANTWTQVAGSINGTVSTATSGQFGFYAGSGNTIIGHTLMASDLPPLSYQPLLTFTGNGAKTASSTGTILNNDCAKWDASGNIIDAGGPCATVATGSPGQFGFYSATGTTISPHTLVAGDIPALNYQSPLSFTGTGAKTITSTAAGVFNNCAKWDASGNVVDAGAPCGNGTTSSSTGTGPKVASAVSAGVSNNCVKWDANGNIVDAGSPCNSGNFASLSGGINTTGTFVIGPGATLSVSGTGSIAATSVPAAGVTGLAASATIDTTNASNIVSGTLPAARLPAAAVTTSLATGSGSRYASATVSGVANNCVKWDASGNIVDAGAPCGSGSGSTLATPSSTTVGNIPQFSNATGTALSIGVGLVTTLGNPGVDTNIPTEKAVRSAIAAATVAAGSLPAQTGQVGYLVSNGTTATWTDLVTGPSGALCAGLGCSGGASGIVDIVTSVVPRLAAANTFTGVNKFQQLQVNLYTVATLPACNSSFEGQMEGVTDAVSPAYLATVTGGGSVHVPVYCNGTSWVAH